MGLSRRAHIKKVTYAAGRNTVLRKKILLVLTPGGVSLHSWLLRRKAEATHKVEMESSMHLAQMSLHCGHCLFSLFLRSCHKEIELSQELRRSRTSPPVPEGLTLKLKKLLPALLTSTRPACWCEFPHQTAYEKQNTKLGRTQV